MCKHQWKDALAYFSPISSSTAWAARCAVSFFRMSCKWQKSDLKWSYYDIIFLMSSKLGNKKSLLTYLIMAFNFFKGRVEIFFNKN